LTTGAKVIIGNTLADEVNFLTHSYKELTFAEQFLLFHYTKIIHIIFGGTK